MEKLRYKQTYRRVISGQTDGVGDLELVFEPIPPGHCAYLEYINLDTAGAAVPILRASFGGPVILTLLDAGPENLAPGLRAGAGETFRVNIVATANTQQTVTTQWRLMELVREKPARVSADRQPPEPPLSPPPAEKSRRPGAEPQPEGGLPRPDSDAGIREANPFPTRR